MVHWQLEFVAMPGKPSMVIVLRKRAPAENIRN
jgi:hypothetical protein